MLEVLFVDDKIARLTTTRIGTKAALDTAMRKSSGLLHLTIESVWTWLSFAR